jgi:hypothetical protein
LICWNSTAYLLPAALWAATRDRRVIVSTHTRALQEQLMNHELPTAARAMEALGLPLRFAMLMGADKRSATEFSFYLAMPTMAGAFAKDLFDNYKYLSRDDVGLIVIGFIVSFISALFVVRVLLDYVSRHGFRLFAWWRIIVGALGFAGLIILG